MKLLRKVGVTSEIWQIFIADSSSTTGAGLTGLTNASGSLTAYYHRDTDTTATAISLVTMTVGTFTSSGFKEIDATNMPGWYQFCPPNAALASGAKSCAFHLKGATNMAPLPIEVDLDGQVDVTFWNGTVVATPATAGIPDVNAKNVNNVATTSVTTINANLGQTQPVNFTGTGASALVKSDTVDIAGAAVSASTAQLGVNVVNWTGTAVATPNTAGVPVVDTRQVIRVNTAQSTGNTTTAIKLDAGASATTDFYKYHRITVVSGTGSPESAICTAYNGSTKVATVSPAWPTAPDNTSVFVVETTAQADLETILGTASAGAAGYTGPDWGHVNAPTTTVNLSGTTIATVTNQLTAAAIATGVWQDATAGDFTTASSIGKSLYTSGVVPGGSGGLLISGSNAGTTTLGALTVTGASTFTGAVTGTNASNDLRVNTFAINSVSAASVTTVAANVGTAQPLNFTGTGASALVKGDVVDWAGTAVATPNTAGVPVVDERNVLRTGTAQSTGNSTTAIKLDASASATTNFYKYHRITVVSGTGSVESAICTAYDGTTKIATVAPAWPTAPDNTSVFVVTADAQVDLEAILGTAVSTSTAQLGVNLVNVAGSAVNTASAQLGVNVVNAGGQAVTLDANNALNVSAKYWGGSLISSNSIPVNAAAGSAGGLLLSGAANAGTTSFAAMTVTGALTTGSVVNNGTTTLTGAVSLSSTLAVASTTTLSALVTASITNNGTTILTGAVSLGSTLSTTGAVTFNSFAPNFVANAITATTIADAAIDRATFAADTGLQTIRSNTAAAGAATTITLDGSASATDNFYQFANVYLTGGTGAGQAREILSYVGSTKVATVRAWTTNPDNTTTFAILPAISVWDDVTASHLTSGSTGASLNAAGSAGDPWGTTLPGAYGAGTAGHIVGTALPDIAPGSANGLLRGGTNAATTFATLTSTGAFSINGVSDVAQTGDSFALIGATGSGLTSLAPSSTALSTVTWTNGLATNLTTLSGHDPGATLASQTNITAGTITTATNVTTVNGLAANVVTASSIAAAALNGKGDWLASASYPTNFGALGISVGGHVSNVDTLTTYTGDTPQTGDSFARIGATGSGLTSLAPSATALSTAVWTAPPTGFLAATFPSGTIVNNTTTPTWFSTGTAPTAAQNATAVWTDLLASSDFSTAASIGKLLKDDVNAPIGSLPTLAQILAGGNVDGYTLEQTLKLCLAALAGKIAGASGTTITIRAADDSKTRVTAVVDQFGNRTAVTLDAT